MINQLLSKLVFPLFDKIVTTYQKNIEGVNDAIIGAEIGQSKKHDSSLFLKIKKGQEIIQGVSIEVKKFTNSFKQKNRDTEGTVVDLLSFSLAVGLLNEWAQELQGKNWQGDSDD